MTGMPNDDTWRFQKIAQATCRFVMSGDYGEEPVMQQLLHIMDKAFQEGLKEGMKIGESGAIPVTDLTHIPEIIDHAGHRWKKGICH